MRNSKKESRYLRVDGVSDYLKVSKSMVYKMVNRREIPFVRIGTRLIFNQEDIDKWISSKSEIETSFTKIELPELPNFHDYGNI